MTGVEGDLTRGRQDAGAAPYLEFTSLRSRFIKAGPSRNVRYSLTLLFRCACSLSRFSSSGESFGPAANAKKPTRSVESKAERVAAAKTLRKADEPRGERVTKQERMLTLLSRPEGASIAEMMQATDWQQHSVRGFLAGTVKKKLGFSLTASKAAGDVRRYRIATRRGR
jgi:Protein of unknown function (DUF3489)